MHMHSENREVNRVKSTDLTETVGIKRYFYLYIYGFARDHQGAVKQVYAGI